MSEGRLLEAPSGRLPEAEPTTTMIRMGTAKATKGTRQLKAAVSPAPTSTPATGPRESPARWAEYTRVLASTG